MQGGQAITPRSCMQLGVITTSEYIGGEGGRKGMTGFGELGRVRIRV